MLQNGEEIPSRVETLAQVPFVTHELPSSGIVYIDIGLSLAGLSLEDLSYLPLLATMMIEGGTTELPPSVLTPMIGQYTGGITTQFSFRPAPEVPFTIADPYASRGLFFLSGKVGCVEKAGYIHLSIPKQKAR